MDRGVFTWVELTQNRRITAYRIEIHFHRDDITAHRSQLEIHEKCGELGKNP